MMACLALTAAHAAEAPKVDPALCRAAVAYTPSADVDYKPGVDVRGHYVAPADVASDAPALLPPKINIPLTVSLAKALNFDTTQYPFSQLGAGTEAQIGTLTVEGNKVTLNGQPLSGAQQSDVQALCAKQGR